MGVKKTLDSSELLIRAYRRAPHEAALELLSLLHWFLGSPPSIPGSKWNMSVGEVLGNRSDVSSLALSALAEGKIVL